MVSRVGQDYPEVELTHMYVDNASMQLVRAPQQFDVMVTSNLFGDILSDTAAMLTGSIGMLPSASLDINARGMYEPVHGSAPDIAGKNLANPLATILSLAMLLRYSLRELEHAERIETAVGEVLDQGLRTADIAGAADSVGTTEMGMPRWSRRCVAPQAVRLMDDNMKRVGFVGWRGMVGSVLMQRMLDEQDFARIEEPVFFTTSQAGETGPDIGRAIPPLQDANDLQQLQHHGCHRQLPGW